VICNHHSFFFKTQYEQSGGIFNSAIILGIGIVHNYWPQFIWVSLCFVHFQ